MAGLRSARHSVLLSPNQQALRSAQELKVAPANIEEVVAWKNGYFRINNDDIHSVMRKLSRWYDFEFVFEGGLPNEGYNGTISRYKNIHQVLAWSIRMPYTLKLKGGA